MISYSVIIRTTGNAGEKYRKLLDSIDKLKPAPSEVVVVLPKGYDLPKEQLGYETFLYSEKGMVVQRLHGIMYCKTPYALITDDDISFEKDFVQKLHKPIEEGLCSISAGPLLSFLPPRNVKGVVSAVCAAGVPTVFHKDKYCTVLSSSGYSYNRNIDTSKCTYMEANTLPWTCFYGDVQALRAIKLEDEVWLDAHGYGAMDDLTMFYKASLRGIKTMVVTNALYEHLDAKTSTSDRKKEEIRDYALVYNRFVFWHRFIYSLDHGIKKQWDFVCYAYRWFSGRIFDYINVFRGKKSLGEIAIKKEALQAAKKYIASDEYSNLAKVKEE